MEYKGKGYSSGKSHSFKATVMLMPGMGGQGKRETVIEGTWHEKSQFVKGGSGDFHDVHAVKEVSPIGGGKDGRWALVGRVISRRRVRRSHGLRSVPPLFALLPN